MAARHKTDAKHFSHDLSSEHIHADLSVSPIDSSTGRSWSNLDLTATESGDAVAIKMDTDELRAVCEYVASRFEGCPLMRHPFTLLPHQEIRRNDDYLALCDWPGCNQSPAARVHHDANGKSLGNAAHEPDPDYCGICGLYHGRRRPVNAEPRFVVTGLTAHAEVGMFYATTIDPADPGDVQAIWTVHMQSPSGMTGEHAEYKGNRWSSYTQPALRALLRRGDLTGAYRYAAGRDLIDMLETGYISSLYADIEPSVVERDNSVYRQWIEFAQEQDSFWKPATMHAGSQPELADAPA